jgi:hypothetical protein
MRRATTASTGIEIRADLSALGGETVVFEFEVTGLTIYGFHLGDAARSDGMFTTAQRARMRVHVWQIISRGRDILPCIAWMLDSTRSIGKTSYAGQFDDEEIDRCFLSSESIARAPANGKLG